MTSPGKEKPAATARAVVLADDQRAVEVVARGEIGGPEQTPCRLKKVERLEVDRSIGLELHQHVGVQGKAGLTVLQMVALVSLLCCCARPPLLALARADRL